MDQGSMTSRPSTAVPILVVLAFKASTGGAKHIDWQRSLRAADGEVQFTENTRAFLRAV
jgi:hypothetical protein